MKEFLAVAPDNAAHNIKQQLLLFDRVGVVENEDWAFRKDDPSLAADLDWLENKNLVFKVGHFLNRECGFELVENPRAKSITIKLVEVPKDKIKEVIDARLGLDFAVEYDGKPVRNLKVGLTDLACRWEAERLRESTNADVVSLCPPQPEINSLLGMKSEKGDVVRVLLRDFPQPSDSTSLEHILQFKQDPESKDKMFAFHHWAKTMMSQNAAPHEVAEELEWLAHEYQQHMRVHRMKVNRGTLEIVLTAAAELAENLVKLRWGKLSKLPFSVSHRKIDLMEAELKAPGREIAYLVKTRNEFRR